MMKKIPTALCWTMFATMFLWSASARAQMPKTDVALTFTADRTNPVSGANQWLEGGSVEFGVNAWHGFGVAARVTGVTTSAIGGQAVPLNLVLTTFGPRYRWTHKPASRHGISIYGEGLIGEASGFKSLFPASAGTIDGANTLALQVGGGMDFALGHHFAYRLVEANWTRTQFQNATTGAQNHLQLGCGIVARF